MIRVTAVDEETGETQEYVLPSGHYHWYPAEQIEAWQSWAAEAKQRLMALAEENDRLRAERHRQHGVEAPNPWEPYRDTAAGSEAP